MRLEHAVTVDDLRRIARRRLPPPVFDLLEGGAGDEITLRANRSAFDEVMLRPRPLAGVGSRDLATTVLGERVSMPILLAPTGAGRVAHRSAELAVAAAAGQADTVYMQSTVTSYELEDVAWAAGRPLWFQLYLPPDPADTPALLARVSDAGVGTVALTIDTPVFGNRERDVRNRVTIPARITPRLVLQGATRPAWSAEFLRGNLMLRGKPGSNRSRQLSPTATQEQILATQWPVTWADVERIRRLWPGRLLLKGVMRAEECPRMVELGIDGLVVSNHGGRQLDGVRPTIEALPEVVAAVPDSCEVLLDGGVRRGVDVVKALALGARAVLVGRPYLYGLAAGGERGVSTALGILRAELDRAMALVGAADVASVTRDLVAVPARTTAEQR